MEFQEASEGVYYVRRALQQSNETWMSPGDGGGTSENDSFILRTTFKVYGSIFGGLVVLFCILRRRYPRYFSIRSWVPHIKTDLAMDNHGLIRWSWDLRRFDDSVIMDNCGMDALCFLRTLKFGFKLTIAGILNSVWLIPIYVTSPKSPETENVVDTFQRATTSNVPAGSHRFLATVFAAYIIFFYTMYLILQEFRWYTKYRHKYLAKKKPQNYTVYVSGIPPEYRSSFALTDYFRQCFSTEGVLEAHVTMDIPELEGKVALRDRLVARWEHAIALEAVKGETPTHYKFRKGKLETKDTISSMEEKVRKLNREIKMTINQISARNDRFRSNFNKMNRPSKLSGYLSEKSSTPSLGDDDDNDIYNVDQPAPRRFRLFSVEDTSPEKRGVPSPRMRRLRFFSKDHNSSEESPPPPPPDSSPDSGMTRKRRNVQESLEEDSSSEEGQNESRSWRFRLFSVESTQDKSEVTPSPRMRRFRLFSGDKIPENSKERKRRYTYDNHNDLDRKLSTIFSGEEPDDDSDSDHSFFDEGYYPERATHFRSLSSDGHTFQVDTDSPSDDREEHTEHSSRHRRSDSLGIFETGALAQINTGDASNGPEDGRSNGPEDRGVVSPDQTGAFAEVFFGTRLPPQSAVTLDHEHVEDIASLSDSDESMSHDDKDVDLERGADTTSIHSDECQPSDDIFQVKSEEQQPHQEGKEPDLERGADTTSVHSGECQPSDDIFQVKSEEQQPHQEGSTSSLEGKRHVEFSAASVIEIKSSSSSSRSVNIAEGDATETTTGGDLAPMDSGRQVTQRRSLLTRLIGKSGSSNKSMGTSSVGSDPRGKSGSSKSIGSLSPGSVGRSPAERSENAGVPGSSLEGSYQLQSRVSSFGSKQGSSLHSMTSSRRSSLRMSQGVSAIKKEVASMRNDASEVAKKVMHEVNQEINVKKIADYGVSKAKKVGRQSVQSIMKVTEKGVENMKTFKAFLTGELEGSPRNAGFVTFTKLSTTHAALQMIHHPKPFTMKCEEAPAPEDIYWKNVGMPHKQLQIGKVMSLGFTFLLCCFWTIPISFISSLTEVEGLKNTWPGLESILLKNPWLQTLLEQIAPLLLLVLNGILPVILREISKLEGLIGSAQLEASLFVKMASFQVIQTFFISAISGGIWASISEIVDNPGTFVNLLANSLPSQSTYFIQISLVSTFIGMPLELLRVLPLGMALVRRFVGPNLTEKERSKGFLWIASLEDPWDFQMAEVFGANILYFMVFWVYCTIAPLTCYFLAFCYLILASGYRHQFVYNYPKDPDSGGKMWSSFIHFCLVGMLIAELTLVGMLTLKKATVAVPFIFPLIAVTILFNFYIGIMHFYVTNHLPTRECIQLDRKNYKKGWSNVSFSEAYLQPALKARDVVADNLSSRPSSRASKQPGGSRSSSRQSLTLDQLRASNHSSRTGGSSRQSLTLDQLRPSSHSSRTGGSSSRKSLSLDQPRPTSHSRVSSEESNTLDDFDLDKLL